MAKLDDSFFHNDSKDLETCGFSYFDIKHSNFNQTNERFFYGLSSFCFFALSISCMMLTYDKISPSAARFLVV